MPETPLPRCDLSPREREVAEAYAEGLSHKQIAERLHIAPATVRTHLGAIYRKLGVSNKIQLLEDLRRAEVSEQAARRERLDLAAERGLVEPDDPWWAVSAVDPSKTGHRLLPRVSGLRRETRRALQSSLLGSERIEPWLRASGVHFQAVAEALPGVVLLKDLALRYVYANRFFLAQWQLRADQVAHRIQQEVFSGGLGFAWSRATDDRDARVLQTGQATGFYLVRVLLGAGRDSVLWARKLPLRNAEGRISHVLTIGIDVTTLERAEEKGTRLPSAAMPSAKVDGESICAAVRARILVIDAEPETRQLSIEALERIGHTVETAASGHEALACLALRRFDLIVADISDSDIHGSTLQQVLAVRHPELLERLVFTSRRGPFPGLNDVANTGARLLEKPFAARDIVAWIESKFAQFAGTHRES